MKRRSFLKGFLAGLTGAAIGPDSFIKELVDKEIKPIIEKTSNSYMALLDDNYHEINNGDGYSRIKTENTWELDGDGLANSKPIIFPQAAGAWGKIRGFAFFDKQKGGHLLLTGKLSRCVTICNGDTIEFGKHYIRLTL